MASWFERGRPAIFKALAAVCDQIDTDLNIELQDRDQIRENRLVTEELEILRSRASEVDRLEEENRTLRAKLLRFHQDQRCAETAKQSPNAVLSANGNGQDPSPTRNRGPVPPVPVNQPVAPTPPPTVPIANVDGEVDVLRESQKLNQAFKKLGENYRRVTGEYRKQKTEIRQWEAYSKRLEFKLEALEQKYGALPSDALSENGISKPRERRPSPTDELTPGANQEQPDMASSFTSDAGSASRTTAREAFGHRGVHGSRIISGYSKIGSQSEPPPDSTEGDTTDGDKDANVINLPPLPRIALDYRVPEVKAEPSSDGPVIVSERCIRKRKYPPGSVIDEPETRRVKLEHSSSDPAATGERHDASTQDSMDLDEVGQRLTTPRKQKHLPRFLAEQLRAGGPPVFVRPEPGFQSVTKSFPEVSALTPMNPNMRLLRTYGTKSVDRPFKKGLSEGISTLAEDGATYKTHPNAQRCGDTTRTPQTRGRLDTLLNIPSPGQGESAIIRSAPRLRDNMRTTVGGPHAPERRALPFEKEGREKAMTTTPANKGATEKAQASTGSKASPRQPATKPRSSLRSKAPATLRLEDFKINPKSNDGQDYAFSDVVRSKDDRACLQGCTDLDCCGKQFRALALAQQNSLERSQIEDMKLFEDYLGDRISIVWGMSKEQKEDLWLEAKTWQLANQLGKHRHRYSRMRSPPGFWRADFPSTQEIQEEKQEAGQRENKMIRERYREAMRPGGRWLFRDE